MLRATTNEGYTTMLAELFRPATATPNTNGPTTQLLAPEGVALSPALPTKVTRDMAERWLGANHANRKLRRTRVDAYRSDMDAGRWRGNDSVIKVNHRGELINGQHRLTAFLASGLDYIWLLVQVADGTAADYRGDNGIGRTIRDATGDPTLLSAAANALLRTYALHSYTRDEIIAASEPIRATFLKISTTPLRGWTLAGVVGGVILSAHRFPSNADEIIDQYNGIATCRHMFESWPSVHAFQKQLITAPHQPKGIDRLANLVLRSCIAFNPDNRSITRIAIKDASVGLAVIRPLIREMLDLD